MRRILLSALCLLSLGAADASGCLATDGDTLRCGEERIRLLGIDAPELPGHCRASRVCVAGDGAASRASLARALAGDIRIERIGTDRYRRTLALVSADGHDLSCHQLKQAQAVYVARWDNGRRVARTCSAAISG
jgi:endonuclease YncB( thermonuclease family)